MRICAGTRTPSEEASVAHLQFQCRDMMEEALSSSRWNLSCEIGQKQSSSNMNPRGSLEISCRSISIHLSQGGLPVEILTRFLYRLIFCGMRKTTGGIFCTISNMQTYTPLYYLLKKPWEMIRWNPKSQRHRNISGCHYLLNCGAGAKCIIFRCSHDSLLIRHHKTSLSPHPCTVHTPPKTRLREIPKTTTIMFEILSHKSLNDCQPLIQWTTFKTFKHFESSV